MAIFNRKNKPFNECLASNTREMILNSGLSMAMEFGNNWLYPINGRLSKKYNDLPCDERATINKTCRDAMFFGHNIVYEYVNKYGKSIQPEEIKNIIREKYPWIDQKNLDHLYSQGMYYAWKDGLL